MTKREQTRMVKANHRQIYLDTWAHQSMSLRLMISTRLSHGFALMSPA
jgi:hypothetical protein